LCLSGGVALNCTANGLLLKEKLFEEIYVQPAAGDAGGAVGSALYVHYKLTGDNKRSQPFFGIGPTYSQSDVKKSLDANGITYQGGPEEKLLKLLAEKIAGGAIVGLFQGAMEFGPRALGFRSIIADPRDNAMKEKINAAVKYREPFRPFAPAVMIERAKEYFDCAGEAPYMIFNYTVNADQRQKIPAVTHVDQSSRIQTVSEKDNPVFYKLLGEFDKITGVPVLLNTSFNLRGYPIVNTPQEAFETFCTGGIDLLYIQGYLLSKQDIAPEIINRFILNKKFD
jgi:carbamoyltransferase